MSKRADLAMTPNSSPRGTASRGSPGSGLAVTESGAVATRAMDLFAGAIAVVLPVAISPGVSSYTFTPKLAVLLVVVGVGLPCLVPLAISSPRRVAARAIIAFLAVGLVSALLSRSVTVGIFGLFGWGNGWLLLCGVAAAWAIGESVSGRGKDLVMIGLLVGISVNAVLALVQSTAQLTGPVLGPFQAHQADGLMGNPIYLESLLLGGLAILLVRSAGTTLGRAGGEAAALFLAALLAAALELSGERFGVVLLGLLLAYGVVCYRSPRAVRFGAASVAGYGLGYAASSTVLHSRLTTLSVVTSNPRVTMWHVALRYLEHHLLLGSGPGNFASAITSYDSLALTRHLAVGTYFADGHDVFVQVVVTTGLAGLACFLVFLAAAFRGASGPLLAFALLALAVELVEPLNVAVTPLAFLALGAASTRRVANVAPRNAAGAGASARAAAGHGRSRLVLAARSVLVVLGVAAGGIAIAGDALSYQGLEHFSYGEAATGARLLAVFADPAGDAARVAAYRGFVAPGGSRSPDARSWFLRAVSWRTIEEQRDPTSPETWVDLGDAELLLGRVTTASTDFHEALRLDRWTTHALVALGQLAQHRSDETAARKWFHLAVESAPHFPPAIQGLAHARVPSRG